VLSDYSEWLQESSFRKTLSRQKHLVTRKLQDIMNNDADEYSEELLKVVTNRILKEIILRNNAEMSSEELDVIILKQRVSLTEALA